MSFFSKKISDLLLVNDPASNETGYWLAVLQNPLPTDTLELEAVWNKPQPPETNTGDSGDGTTATSNADPNATGNADNSAISNTSPGEGDTSAPPPPPPPDPLASLVFCTTDSAFANADDFIKKINQILNDKGLKRAIIWLISSENIDAGHAIVLGISEDGKSVAASLSVPDDYFLPIHIQAGSAVSLSEQTFSISGAIKMDVLGNTILIKSGGNLDLAGNRRAALRFSMGVPQSALSNKIGFQFHFPLDDHHTATEWLPLALIPNDSNALTFNAVIHPLDVFSEQFDNSTLSKAYQSHVTFLEFSTSTTVFDSYYRTVFGEPIALLPLAPDEASAQNGLAARLLFTKGFDSANGNPIYYLTPEGDFILQTTNKSDTPQDLICGLQGTEFFEFRGKSSNYPGERLRFLSQQPAYAPDFPFVEASPLGPPLDAKAPLLTRQYTTAWAMVVPGGGDEKIEYVPQAQDAALYGNDGLVSTNIQALFGHVSPAYTLPQSGQLLFPMPPYAGLTPKDDSDNGFNKNHLEMFESQVLSTTRRDAIGDASETQASSTRLLRARSLTAAKTDFNVTTPDGVIIEIDTSSGGAKWKKITLGQKTSDLIAFFNPVDNLQQAFSTPDLFLVVANPVNLGSNNASDTSGTAASYDAQINLENWILNADVGANDYGDYSNIMIFKAQKGALYDSDPKKSLVANPNKWTQKADFAAPASKDKRSEQDTNQLIVLSNWLQNYFKEAAEQDKNPFFDKFNTLATDPNWQGFLILRMDIQTLPQELAGIRAGVKDEKAFYAHHFGIEINQIVKDTATDVKIQGDSSMFGLIYYEDPDFTKPAKGQPVQPVPPDNADDYDFRLLTLKVLFENTAIKDFESYVQVTLNSMFGMRPTRMGANGNNFNTIVLQGSYQNVNGKPVYGLSTETDYSFFFDNNLFNKVELTGAQLLTRGIKNDDVTCWFAMHGYLDFRIMTRVRDKVPVDLIGFGSTKNLGATEDGTPRQGLHFSNLGLEMNFNKNTPQDKTFTFNIKEIRFDQARSTPRRGSLYTDFAMELKGMITGTKDIPPTMQNYLNVTSDIGTAGVSGSDWFGLRYHLSLGSPGDLAGKINLDSELLFAWSPESKGDSSYKAMIGIELPGTGGGANLFDLQNVLKLSIGQVRLLYADQGANKGFLLMLTEIALKFLGLLKIPPNGSTNFYLFGNPNAGGDPSGLGWYALYRQSVPQ